MDAESTLCRIDNSGRIARPETPADAATGTCRWRA